MKVWVDISAPAHVLVFRPLIALLRERGDEIEVTTRDYAQTLELLDRHGIEAEVLGATAAAPAWARRALDVSAARAQALCEGPRLRRRARARLARADDDRAAARDPERDDPRLRVRDAPAPSRRPAATKVVVPEAIPLERMARFGVRPPKLLQYPGLKEEYYLHDFEPDPTRPRRAGVNRERTLVVVARRRTLALPPALEPVLPELLGISGAKRPYTRSCSRAAPSSASTFGA